MESFNIQGIKIHFTGDYKELGPLFITISRENYEDDLGVRQRGIFIHINKEFNVAQKQAYLEIQSHREAVQVKRIV